MTVGASQSSSPSGREARVDVSVVIVNYNVRHFLEQCLRSVERAGEGLTVEVFVVDNASSDDSLSTLSRFPKLHVIANPDNRGFARANNQAISRATGRYVLLLNPDTLLAEDALARCVEYADAHDDVGCIGARMIDGCGEFLPESKRGFPGPWVSFAKMSGLGRLFPASEQLNGYYLGHLGEHETNEVDVLPGAFMFLRSTVLAQVGGGLDEDYFMYGEDVDLSYSIQKLGYKNIYLPAVTIVHYKGESTRKRSLSYVRSFYGAMAIFARKHIAGAQSGLRAAVIFLAIYARAALALLANTLASILVPLLDAATLCVVLFGVKQLWATYYFGDATYYDVGFGATNYLIYVGLWLVSMFFAGGYDVPYRLGAAIRGLGFGTLTILVVYALLPEAYRTSRAIVLISAAAGAVALVGVRGVWSLLRPRDVRFTARARGKNRRLAILGTQPEATRVLSLLAQAGIARDYVGRVATPDEKFSDSTTLGDQIALPDLLETYRVDELIICNRDVSYQATIAALQTVGSAVEIRTVAEAADAVVGSPSRHSRGASYAVEREFELASSQTRRDKRLFDLVTAITMLLLPPLCLLARRPLGVLRNAVLVVLGRLTWVGYSSQHSVASGLPSLRRAVLPQGLKQSNLQPQAALQLNRLYARQYTVADDWRTVWRLRRQLGRIPAQPAPVATDYQWASAKTVNRDA